VLAVFGERVQPKRYEGKNEAEKQLSGPSLRGSVIAMLKEDKKRIDEQIEQFLNEQKGWQEQRGPVRLTVQEAWISHDQGRQDGCAECALHVHYGSDALQPLDPGSIPAIIETWQSEESCAHGMHTRPGGRCRGAKVSDDPERDGARPATFPRLTNSCF
jgi:hypothetical protein